METSAIAETSGLSMILWPAGVAIFLLIVLGAGSRFVVFSDKSDLLWTAGIVLFPIATIIVAGIGFATITPPLGEGMKLGDVTFPMLVTTYLFPTIVCCVTSLLFLRSVFITIVGTIMNNGLLAGLFIVALKLTAIVPILIAAIGGCWLYFDSANDVRRNWPIFLVLGFFVWLASRMINGERVMERRMLISQTAEA
ncbi:hypothetical protein [Microvirga flavescens]|uniref:hypothetical protein n=1 Tax=Microvirga flavescens TaxID=2249811 RepID=UPI00130052CA|nr:hypothetical protein [Microvirga flavescens]